MKNISAMKAEQSSRPVPPDKKPGGKTLDKPEVVAAKKEAKIETNPEDKKEAPKKGEAELDSAQRHEPAVPEAPDEEKKAGLEAEVQLDRDKKEGEQPKVEKMAGQSKPEQAKENPNEDKVPAQISFCNM